MRKKLIFTLLIIFVILSALFFWFYRDRIFSKAILRIEILGPEKVKAGEEIEYIVKYKNNSNFVLESPKLVFELPEYSLTEDGKNRFNQNLNDIYAGEENLIKFNTRLLGKEGDFKTAKVWLSYIPKNLSARYESFNTFSTKIETVPITLTYDLPYKLEKGKQVSYAVNYFSNIDYPLEDLSLKIEPVVGFQFEESIPSSLDQIEWKLDTLNKSNGGRIIIKGLIIGNPGDKLNFNVKMGMWQNGNFIIIKETNQEAEIISPLLYISQQVNNSVNYVASPGQILNYQIFIRNIGSTPFEDLFVISRLESPGFDLSTLTSQNGSVQANDNLIIWDPKQLLELRSLNPQEEIKLDFQVKLKDWWNISDLDKNNVILKNKVNVADISQEFTVKVNTNLAISQTAYYSSREGMVNYGPVPPVVGQTTTYIVYWEAKNYFNDVKNVKVKAVLPQNVSLIDDLRPESELSRFSFDNVSREIVWAVGDMSADGSRAVVYFQVALIPTTIQQGQPAVLIGSATIFGEDQTTNTILQSSASPLNTILPNDQSNSGNVIAR